ncbi:MAG TPA: flagellin [Planctomycetota bacterium]|jgi:flagellin|nr:flagellin [Planctomycetota bacterium]
MALRINSNLSALDAQRGLSSVTGRLERNFQHLSTGLRISTAADDAAGLGISERLRAQIASLSQAQRNANDGISLTQTAEGSLNEVSNILIRMRELATEAANGTVSDSDKATLNSEFSDLINEVDRIAQSSDFNNVKLLDGSTTAITFQVGAGVTANDTISVSLTSSLGSDLGITSLDISSAGSSTTAITAIDSAIDTVSSTRGRLGAAQNRLMSTIANLGVSIESLSAANSRIRDVDVAAETADLTRNSILQQAAISVLSQANLQPQTALRLLQNLG